MSGDRTPSLTELAARVLREAEMTLPTGVPPTKEERAAHLVVLVDTIREERARASRRRWLGGSLAVAASVALAFGLRGLSSDPSKVALATRYDVHVEGAAAEIIRHAGASAPTTTSTDPAMLHTGDHARAPRGSVAVLIATGTKLTLDPGADVAVAETGSTQIFALESGSLRADVAKLHGAERFLVRTDDTEVEVRGTSFRVERVDTPSPCMPELRTRVLVFEGVVVVRHAGIEARIAGGGVWPAACDPSSVDRAERAPLPGPALAPTASAPRVSSGATSSVLPPAGSASQLAAANELFGKAEAARKSGDARGSVALFDRLLAEHPSSPLVEHATVERMRALDQVDPQRAVAAARDYLARFPRGFARSEAEAIVAFAP